MRSFRELAELFPTLGAKAAQEAPPAFDKGKKKDRVAVGAAEAARGRRDALCFPSRVATLLRACGGFGRCGGRFGMCFGRSCEDLRLCGAFCEVFLAVLSRLPHCILGGCLFATPRATRSGGTL